MALTNLHFISAFAVYFLLSREVLSFYAKTPIGGSVSFEGREPRVSATSASVCAELTSLSDSPVFVFDRAGGLCSRGVLRPKIGEPITEFAWMRPGKLIQRVVGESAGAGLS